MSGSMQTTIEPSVILYNHKISNNAITCSKPDRTAIKTHIYVESRNHSMQTFFHIAFLKLQISPDYKRVKRIVKTENISLLLPM